MSSQGSAYPWFCGMCWRREREWCVWFRIKGYGLSVSDMRPLFSERYGITRHFRLFGIKIMRLAPGKP